MYHSFDFARELRGLRPCRRTLRRRYPIVQWIMPLAVLMIDWPETLCIRRSCFLR
jgi:hypothetical protein